MTYRELAQLIDTMTPEQKNQDVTLFDKLRLEYSAISTVQLATDEDGELDPGHPFLVLD